MNQKTAHRRYMKVFVPSMAIYLLSVLGVAYLRKNTGISVNALAALTPHSRCCRYHLDMGTLALYHRPG